MFYPYPTCRSLPLALPPMILQYFKNEIQDALQRFDHELSTLVFARVIRSTCKDEHRQHSVADATTDDAYSYYSLRRNWT